MSPSYTPMSSSYAPTSPLYTPQKSSYTQAPVGPPYTLTGSLHNPSDIELEPMSMKIESNISSLKPNQYETWCCIPDIEESTDLHGQKGDKHYIKILKNLHHSQLSMLADTIDKIAKQKKDKAAARFATLKAEEQEGEAFNLRNSKKMKY